MGRFEHGDVKLSRSNKQGRRGNRTDCSFELLGSVLDIGYTSCLYFKDDRSQLVRDQNLASTAYNGATTRASDAANSYCDVVLYTL